MFGIQRSSGKETSIAILLLTLIATCANPSRSLAETPDNPTVVHQLRIYELHKDNELAFHDRFQEHAMRIMRKYDFNIVSTWKAEQEHRVEFVYLLEWPDEETMRTQWEKFMADQEWSDIKKETGILHGRFVNGIQDRKLTSTSYSPNKVLAH